MSNWASAFRPNKKNTPQLSDEKAQAILDATGKSADIAKAHGVSASLVNAIKRRAKYKHLTPSAVSSR